MDIEHKWQGPIDLDGLDLVGFTYVLEGCPAWEQIGNQSLLGRLTISGISHSQSGSLPALLTSVH